MISPLSPSKITLPNTLVLLKIKSCLLCSSANLFNVGRIRILNIVESLISILSDEIITTRSETFDTLKPALLKALKKYSSPYKSSLFGHHHEARIQAVIKAMSTVDSVEIATKILNHQLSLMKDETPSLLEENTNNVSFDLLSKRWQSQLPKHRALTTTQQSRSGYVKVLEEALSLLQRERDLTSDTETRTSRPDTNISSFSYR